jgi:hypothetical protein
MMFIPWFQVDNASDGGTTHVAALAVTVVHDDERGLREIVVQGREKPIPTRLSVDEIFDRMGDAIEGARNAEMEALYPLQTLDASAPQAEGHAVPERDSSGSQPVEPIPGWIPGGGGVISPKQARIDMGYTDGDGI